MRICRLGHRLVYHAIGFFPGQHMIMAVENGVHVALHHELVKFPATRPVVTENKAEGRTAVFQGFSQRGEL